MCVGVGLTIQPIYVVWGSKPILDEGKCLGEGLGGANQLDKYVGEGLGRI